MHACLQVYFISLSLHECQGIRWLLIYLGVSSFSSLNSFSRACATPPTKGNLFKKYLWKEEGNILGTERKFSQILYSGIHKPSKIPVLWQGKMFLLLFYFFKHQSFDFCSGCLFQGSHCYFLEQSYCQWKSVICTVLLFL